MNDSLRTPVPTLLLAVEGTLKPRKHVELATNLFQSFRYPLPECRVAIRFQIIQVRHFTEPLAAIQRDTSVEISRPRKIQRQPERLSRTTYGVAHGPHFFEMKATMAAFLNPRKSFLTARSPPG